MNQPKVVILIFVSGKLVLTGAKTKQDLKVAFCRIFPVLKQFSKKSVAK
jgi:transcription initiation factor TFIID TATA-box-binding protein